MMQKRDAFELMNANRGIAAVDRDLRGRIQLVLRGATFFVPGAAGRLPRFNGLR